MVIGRFGLAALMGLAAAPVAAAEWASVAGWDVHEIDGTRCVVGRTFADAGMTFGLIMSVDGEVRVFATGTGWPTRAGERARAQVAFDGQVRLDAPSVGIEQGGNRGFVAAADAALLEGFAGARRLTVRAGAAGSDAAITGSADGLVQGRRCLSALRAARGSAPPRFVSAPRIAQAPVGRVVPPGTVANASLALAARAVPRASLASWVGDTEYPAAALRAREEGATTVKIAIDPAGTVAACEVARTSGSSALDEETCRIFKRRGRYKPARDMAGTAVASVEQQTIRWKLPE